MTDTTRRACVCASSCADSQQRDQASTGLSLPPADATCAAAVASRCLPANIPVARRDRHGAIGALARSGRWPDKTTAFEPLREQAHALAVVPQHFDQRAAPAAEHE